MGLRDTFRLVTQLDPNKYGTAYGLTSLLPVLPGHEAELEAHLDTLDPLASPFGVLPQLHFTRLLVIRDLVYQGPPQVPEHLDQSYLAWNYTLRSSDGHVANHLDPADGGDIEGGAFGTAVTNVCLTRSGGPGRTSLVSIRTTLAT